LPAIISAALLVFTISLDDYVITSFVAGPGAATLPLKIYSMVKTGVTPEINAISTVLLAATVALVFASERLAAGRMSRWTMTAGASALAQREGRRVERIHLVELPPGRSRRGIRATL
jgi:ABC-type Fe3+ transport system permease subunit